MSLIHIARDNAVLGQFTSEEVRAGLAAGAYLPTDLAWRTGMTRWLPLNAWPEFGEAPPALGGLEPPPPPQEDMPAWENRKALGFFSAIFKTVKQVLKTPDTTFPRMKKTGGFAAPYWFLMIPQLSQLICLGGIFAAMFVFIGSIPEPTGGSTAPMPAMFTKEFMIGMFSLWLILCAAGAFIYSGIIHLMLKIWGAGNASYETTFRTVSYVWGSVVFAALPLQFISWIPCIGIIVSVVAIVLQIWGLIVLIKALAITHRASIGRVAGAVLTPVIVCCGAMAVIYGMVFAAALAGAAAAPRPAPPPTHSAF